MLCLKHLDAKRNSFLTRGPVFFWTHFSDLSCIQGCFTLASPAFPLRVGPGLVMPQYCKINCNFRDSMSKVLLQMRIYTYDLYNLYNMHVYFCMHKYMFPINRSKLSILPDQIILSQVLAFGVLKVNDNFNRHQLNVSISSHILGGSVCLGCKGLLTVMRRLNLFFRLKIYFSSHLFCLFKCRWGGSHLS